MNNGEHYKDSKSDRLAAFFGWYATQPQYDRSADAVVRKYDEWLHARTGTSESCLDMKVTISAKELAQLQQNYETERFRAVCGWKNYEDLKREVEKAGYDPYCPSRLRDENAKLQKRVKALEELDVAARERIAEMEASVGNPAEKVKFTVTRAAYDQLEARANKAELEAAELRRRITNELSGGVRDVQSKLLNAQEALVDSRTECQRLRERTEELEAKVDSLRTDGRMDTLNATRTKLYHAIEREDKLNVRVGELESQLGEKQSDFEEVLEMLREVANNNIAIPEYTRKRLDKCLAKYADVEITF